MIIFSNLSEYYFEKNKFLIYNNINLRSYLKKYKFMSENLNSNNIEKDDFNVKTEDSNYEDLIVKLKEIKSTIALLEKTIFK